MPPKKPKPFSVTKAVKLNARERVGQPKPEKVILNEPRESRQERRHRKNLEKCLQQAEQAEN